MTLLEQQQQARFERVVVFVNERPTAFPAGSKGRSLAEAMTYEVLQPLAQQAMAQATGSGAQVSSTAGKRSLLEAIRQDLSNISRTAKVIEKKHPGFAAQFRLPANRVTEVINAARTFAQLATAPDTKALFLEYDMPADFVEDLLADVQQFEAASTTQAAGSDARVQATQAIDALIERGLEILAALDAITHNKFHNDAATLAAWESASHRERAPRKAASAAPAAPAATPPV